MLQRYRSREDARYRLQVMRALQAPAAKAGIVIPSVRESGLDDDPPWVIFDARPGVPGREAGGAGPGGPRFPDMARSMGQLLAAFRQLPAGRIQLNDLWADPGRLAVRAADWAAGMAVRLADPLFDPAWWAWSVSFSSAAVLEAAWPPFLDGAGIDPGIQDIVAARLRSELR